MKEIYNEVIRLLHKEVKEFESTTLKDNNKYGQKIEFEKIIKIITTYKNKDEIKCNDQEVVSGFGNIACICDESPYIVTQALCMAVRTVNNITLFVKEKMVNTNNIILNAFNVAIKNQQSNIKLEINYTKNLNKFYEHQDTYNKLIYIGKQEEYIKVTKRLYIPSSFQNYLDINVYFDSKEYRNILLVMDKYAYLHDFELHYFNNKDIEQDIEAINKQGISSMLVIFTKDLEKVKRLSKEVNCNEIYINKNPFENYMFDLDENNFILRKRIVR